jgi:hypothetical protein
MDRTTLRTLLRRQLGEATADAWADADLNTLLNAGCDRVGAKFHAMAPDRAPITTTLSAFLRETGYEFDQIALPDGFGRMLDVSLLQPDGTYEQIPKRSRAEVEGLTSGDDAAWAYFGSNVIIGPAPAASQANGVRLRHTGGITLAVDASVPPFPVDLHLAIIYEAKAVALGETGEDDTPTTRSLVRIYSDFAAAYLDGGGEPETFLLDRKSSTQY